MLKKKKKKAAVVEKSHSCQPCEGAAALQPCMPVGSVEGAQPAQPFPPPAYLLLKPVPPVSGYRSIAGIHAARTGRRLGGGGVSFVVSLVFVTKFASS